MPGQVHHRIAVAGDVEAGGPFEIPQLDILAGNLQFDAPVADGTGILYPLVEARGTGKRNGQQQVLVQVAVEVQRDGHSVGEGDIQAEVPHDGGLPVQVGIALVLGKAAHLVLVARVLREGIHFQVLVIAQGGIARSAVTGAQLQEAEEVLVLEERFPGNHPRCRYGREVPRTLAGGEDGGGVAPERGAQDIALAEGILGLGKPGPGFALEKVAAHSIGHRYIQLGEPAGHVASLGGDVLGPALAPFPAGQGRHVMGIPEGAGIFQEGIQGQAAAPVSRLRKAAGGIIGIAGFRGDDVFVVGETEGIAERPAGRQVVGDVP